MDETRIERALREGPPFRTHYVGQPLPLSSQATGTHLAPLRHDRRGISTGLIVVVTLLLTLIIGGAALVGSGILKLPAVVDASASPSATADASADASATPVEQVPASWTASGSMIVDRHDYAATLLSDGTVLVTGGMGQTMTGGPEELFPWASAELYHPSSGTWTTTGSMIEGRIGHTATRLLDGRVLVPGVDSYDPDTLTWNGLSAELYDPISGTWTATGRMIEAGTWDTATLLLDGKVLVAGGYGDGGPSGSAELYDPHTGTWTVTGSLIEAGTWHTATLLLDGRVLLTDGGDGDPSSGGSAELYDPDTGTWTVTGSMVEARSWHAATLLSDGTVLVTGGMGSTSTGGMASAELYHPSSGTWTAAGSMIEARYGHTATPLPDGKVLVVGGNSNSYINIGLLTSAELYDPSSGSWTATVTMVEGRNGHTATLLSDGTVLVVGGYGDRSVLLTSAELYDPGIGN